jgi:exodeoxyribonuclease V beta subunit
MRSDRSLFDTDEAREVSTLFTALADPGNETKVRTALVIDLLGRSGDDIAALLENEPEWEACLLTFRDYHQTWLERGFMVMSQELLSDEGVRGRLLRRPDGERRLTNLLHCFETIHGAAHERRLGIEGQVTWFTERVSGGESAEEYQIRLETDEKAVKIVTVHISKGLEYPIVFCPFLWGGIKGVNEVVTFHDEFSMVKDFGSPDYERHRILARKEALAESLRLLYVALTRAKFRCYLVGGKFTDKSRRNRPETSPLAYLFHTNRESRSAEDLVSLQEQEVQALSAEQMREQLEALAADGAGEIAVVPLPDPVGAVPYVPTVESGALLHCRQFTGIIDHTWRVSSFTSFATHDTRESELPDRDRAWSDVAFPGTVPAGEEPQGKSIFTFPRGARAGIFLHEIFEKIDFTSGATTTVTETVVECLHKHNFAAEWRGPVCAMVGNVLATQLGTPEAPFTLADLRQENRLVELEFFFPLRFVTSETLRDCFRRWSGISVAVDLAVLCHSLNFRPARGMMRGFMDLVFEQGGRYYLLDWKSNHLGNRVEEYGQAALKATMESNLYALQYLLYTVALNKYLSLRVRGYDYETHFGGVRYLFLRGIDPNRGSEYGVFRDVPPVGLIRELTACLIETEGCGSSHDL